MDWDIAFREERTIQPMVLRSILANISFNNVIIPTITVEIFMGDGMTFADFDNPVEVLDNASYDLLNRGWGQFEVKRKETKALSVRLKGTVKDAGRMLIGPVAAMEARHEQDGGV
jgi:hypothetical protein